MINIIRCDGIIKNQQRSVKEADCWIQACTLRDKKAAVKSYTTLERLQEGMDIRDLYINIKNSGSISFYCLCSLQYCFRCSLSVSLSIEDSPSFYSFLSSALLLTHPILPALPHLILLGPSHREKSYISENIFFFVLAYFLNSKNFPAEHF